MRDLKTTVVKNRNFDSFAASSPKKRQGQKPMDVAELVEHAIMLRRLAKVGKPQIRCGYSAPRRFRVASRAAPRLDIEAVAD